ncbi:MAG: Kelch repeat-containing protein [Acidobacteriota bacterium]
MRHHCRVVAFAGLALLAGLTNFAGCGGGDAPPVSREGPVGDAAAQIWHQGPRLPAPVANNAVAAVAGQGGVTVLSFLGMDSTKVWSGVTNAAYRWDFEGDEGWRQIEPVPGPGRLASTVQVLGGRVFVFGGYTVAEDGSEKSLPDVNVYDPGTDAWSRAADIPLPVDDAMSGLWRGSRIYLVSGWHDTGNVADVQIYDPGSNTWASGTPIPGEPVFGHSGAIVGDDIIYVGGAKVVEGRPRFVEDRAAWRGRIDRAEPTNIAWEPLSHPPGVPLYRAAAGSIGDLVVLAGGTDNPYNYNGIGYDGEPSSPAHRLLAYDPKTGWVSLPAPPVATMDHRTLGVAGGYVFLVGGMTDPQRVSDRVWYAKVEALLEGR